MAIPGDQHLHNPTTSSSWWQRLGWHANAKASNQARHSTPASKTPKSLRVALQLQRGAFSLELNNCLPLQGITALFGRSGCGKTTLLRAIAGLDRHAGAQVQFSNTVWQQSNTFLPVHRRRIGMVFQESSLLPHLSVKQNLLYGFNRLAKHSDVHLKPEQVIQLLELAPLLQQAPEQLSGGQRQRVALGRALLSQPQLLLLDEPLASLDQQSRSEILPFLQRIASQTGIPILLVSHQLDDVVKLADHLVLMQHGRIHSRGPLQQQLLQPELAAIGAMSLLHAKSHGSTNHLLKLSIGQQQLQLPAPQHSDNANYSPTCYRLRIQARDVALSITPLTNSSVSNQLQVSICGFSNAPHPAETLVKLELEGQPLQALLTTQSVERLGLQIGQQVYAQIKAVALD